ncbi:MAG: hypothetical protein Q4F95_01785 [Oscillospiraceae bacterium]|nr:hypothetical protein [Oscillospiraceae bacterium]
MAYNVILNVAAEVARKHAESGVQLSPDDTVCVIRTNTGNIYIGISRVEVMNGMTSILHAEVDAISKIKAKEDSIIEAISVLNAYTLAPILPCNNCINLILSLNPENVNCLIITPNANIPLTEVNMFIANSSQPRVPNNGMNSGYMPNNYYANDMQNANRNMNSVPPQPGGYVQGYQQYSNQIYANQMAGQSQQFNNSMNSSQLNASQHLNNPVSVNLNNVSQNLNNSAYINSRQTSSLLPPDTTNASKGDMLKNKISDLLNDDVDEDDESGHDSKKKGKKKFGGLFR